MFNNYKKSILILTLAILCLSFGSSAFAQSVGGATVQTNLATNISTFQATLNGYLSIPYISTSNYVYFQWGTSTNYGTQTNQQYLYNTSSFGQIITGLNYNSTYHFRAVAQGSYGTIYGQDMAFTTGQSSNSTVTVNAGPDLYLASGQTGILQGSGFSAYGYGMTYSWTCTGGTLSAYNVAQPTFTAPYLNNQATNTCTLTVTDGYGNSNADSAVVYINYNNNGAASVQTNYVSYRSDHEAILNGTISGTNISATNYVYFQWGTSASYGNQTAQQTIGYTGSFLQDIANLAPGTTYHVRAVAQGVYGTIYGQDVTFTTSGSTNGGYYGNGNLTSNKQVIDLTSGNLNWATSVNAKPSDILSFAITLQATGQDIHNVVIKDVLPSNLIYKGNLMINNANASGDITSGINVGTVFAGQAIVVGYQIQVAPSASFSYGTTTLTNIATITSNEAGLQNSNATVIVNKSLVYGASTVSTGLTNDFLTDSFFLPLLIIIMGLWLYFSGNIYKFADWLKAKI